MVKILLFIFILLFSFSSFAGKLGAIVNLGVKGVDVVNNFKNCGDDNFCKGSQIGRQLPGSAGFMANLALNARTVIRSKNKCHVPSEKFLKAAALINMGGELAGHIVFYAKSKKMLKEYSEISKNDEIENGSGLINEARRLFHEPDKRFNVGEIENKIVKDEKKRNHDGVNFNVSEQTHNVTEDVQLKALEYQRKKHQIELQKMKLIRPFYYTAGALTAAGNTMAYFELLAELKFKAMVAANPASIAAAKQIAPWYPCKITEVNVEEIEVSSIEHRQNLPDDYIEKSFENLNDQEAIAHYLDLNRFLEGEKISLSIDDMKEIKNIYQVEAGSENNLSHNLVMAFKMMSDIIPNSYAFNLEKIQNKVNDLQEHALGGRISKSAIEKYKNSKLGTFLLDGNFNGSTPLGYSERIIGTFIHEALRKACSDESKSPLCKSKSIIEMAAQKATHALLKTHHSTINKIMKTPTGRIIVLSFNLFNLGKMVAQNEKQMKYVQERIDHLSDLEQRYKNLNTSKLDLKLNSFPFLFQLIESAHANEPETDNIAFCIKNNFNLDHNCSASTNEYYKVLGPVGYQQSDLKANIDGLNLVGGKAFNELLNGAHDIANTSNLIFNGSMGAFDIDESKMQNYISKQGQVAGKLKLYSDKMTQQSNVEKFELDKELANFEKVVWNGLPDFVIKEIQKVDSTTDSNQNLIALDEPVIRPSTDSEIKTDPETVSTIIESTPASREIASEKIPEEVADKKFKYSQDDINSNKELDLFKIISVRYKKVFVEITE